MAAKRLVGMVGNRLCKLVRSQIVDGLKMNLDFILSVMESCWGMGDKCELICLFSESTLVAIWT